MHTGDWILKVQDFGVGFRSETGLFQAVQGLNFELNAGQSLCIVGESGSGKSVSMMALMGLLTHGNQLLEGKAWYRPATGQELELTHLGENELRQIRGTGISMIFQEPMTALNPVLSCGDQAGEMLRLRMGFRRKEARERVLELFEEVRLPDPERVYMAYPHALSGGQRQRVMIAMAISCQPRILIADEPTTALDASVQRSIIDLLQGIREKHKLGLIFISHDLQLVKTISDQLIVMRAGQVVEQGMGRMIFSQPRHPYTMGLLSCKPGGKERPHRLAVVEEFMDQGGRTPKATFETSEERVKRHRVLFEAGPILEIKDLEVSFRGKGGKPVPIIHGIGFGVFRGETLGLVGESGCGKSTLGRAILQLIKHQSGQILFKGKNLSGLDGKEMKEIRKRIQIVFQDPYSSLNPRMRIGEALLEPMLVHGIVSNRSEGLRKVEALLERVRLPGKYFPRYPHELSGGQRQRAGIARALALEPELLICDESVSALDVSVQAHILNLLNDLKADLGLSYLFISHDLGVIHYMADRIMVMRAGKMEELAEADQLFRESVNPYTRMLMEAGRFE